MDIHQDKNSLLNDIPDTRDVGNEMKGSEQSSSAKNELNYAVAGVDTHAGDRAVELMKKSISRTHDSTVIGGSTGSFAGMVDASHMLGMKRPLLATSTDGVGTKIAIARAMGIHNTIGQDLVGMVVDDIVVVGAKPLLMTDYIACGKVIPERIALIVTGIADACASIECPLVGGETAEHPGLMAPDDYDIAGAATGVVDADRMLEAGRVRSGDVAIAMASSGLHSNGFSLVRYVVDQIGHDLHTSISDFGRTLGEELLEPTRLYTKICLQLIDKYGVGAGNDDREGKNAHRGIHVFSHVTGGGLGANVARVIPQGLAVRVDRSSWEVPAVFDWVRRGGNISWESLEDTLNLGVGMVAIVGSDSADDVIATIRESGIPAWALGTVVPVDQLAANARVVEGMKGVQGGQVRLYGSYRVGA